MVGAAKIVPVHLLALPGISPCLEAILIQEGEKDHRRPCGLTVYRSALLNFGLQT